MSERAHSIANNFGHREHWNRQDSSGRSPHPEAENQRHDDEDGVEGETFGEEQNGLLAAGPLKLATNRRLVLNNTIVQTSRPPARRPARPFSSDDNNVVDK